MASLRAHRLQLGTREVPYREAWDTQRAIHALRADGAAEDQVLLLEHAPVYTAGKRTEPWERPPPESVRGAEVVDVDRGGKITWHGPGQLVGYPILALAEPLDVVAYVRRVEQMIIAVCEELGLRTRRVEGRSGVWVDADERGPQRKVAAIGIRVSRGVTMHGFAINCCPDLSWFGTFVPCGIDDAGVTSLSAELGRQVSVLEVAEDVERHLFLLLPGSEGVEAASRADIRHAGA
jgi:lipoyl(octanoyl) transferase